MKLPSSEAYFLVCRWCFSGSARYTCGINFSNNISIPQARVTMKKAEYDTTFKKSQKLISRIKDKFFNSFIDWSWDLQCSNY